MAWWPGIHGVMVFTDAQLGHQTEKGMELNKTTKNQMEQKPKGWLEMIKRKESPKNDNLKGHMQTYQKAN